MEEKNNGVNLGKMLANIENMKSDISDIRTDLRSLPEKLASKAEVEALKEKHKSTSDRVDVLQKFMYLATGALAALQFVFKFLFN